MRRLSALLVAGTSLLTLGSVAPRADAGPKPAALEPPAKIRHLFRAYHDGKGNYLVFIPQVPGLTPKQVSLSNRHLYYGTKKALYSVSGRFYGRGTRLWINDRRFHRSELLLEDGDKPIYKCDERSTRLTALSPKGTRELIARAKFRGYYWNREVHLLARNDEGEYFYLSRAWAQRYKYKLGFYPKLSHLRSFRMWRGRRGRMKKQRLHDVVIDAAGQIFLTKKGALHVTVKSLHGGRGYKITKLTWRNRKTNKRASLTHVPIDDANTTIRLIYRHLGPYTGVRFGLPCDKW